MRAKEYSTSSRGVSWTFRILQRSAYHVVSQRFKSFYILSVTAYGGLALNGGRAIYMFAPHFVLRIREVGH